MCFCQAVWLKKCNRAELTGYPGSCSDNLKKYMFLYNLIFTISPKRILSFGLPQIVWGGIPSFCKFGGVNTGILTRPFGDAILNPHVMAPIDLGMIF